MAVGMTFVIVNKDIDLSVGSTYGLVGVVFAIVFSPTHFDLGLAEALLVRACCSASSSAWSTACWSPS